MWTGALRAVPKTGPWLTIFLRSRRKRVVLEEFPQRDRGIMRAFAFNTRRDKFKDASVRRAFNYAFDFEEMNKQFFFGYYRRVNSYFEGTELACSGLPQGEELAILEPLREKLPPEVFTTPYANPWRNSEVRDGRGYQNPALAATASKSTPGRAKL